MNHTSFTILAGSLACGLFTACAEGPIENRGQPPAVSEERPEPDLWDVSYGPSESQALDLWLATNGPTPLVAYFHGGGFRAGDKQGIPPLLLQACREAGMAVASINYRLSSEATYPAAMQDGARAVQFLRSRAREWGLDPERIAATGGSSGAVLSLWIGFHEEFADPASADPVARQSSRLSAIGVFGAPTSWDPRFIAERIGEPTALHERMWLFYGLEPGQFDADEAYPFFEDASPLTHLSQDDPPVFMVYSEPDAPVSPDARPGTGIHHPQFGRILKSQLDSLGIPAELHHRDEYYEDPSTLAPLASQFPDTPEVYQELVEFLERWFESPTRG